MATDMEAPPQTNVERWLDLERERRTLEARLKSIVSTQDHLRLAILERWSMDGTTKEKVDGYTVHLRRGLHPKPVDPSRLALALYEAGLTDLLTVDLKMLGAWLSVKEEEGRPILPEIKELIGEPYERFALAVKLK
jgi:hypothetical protein